MQTQKRARTNNEQKKMDDISMRQRSVRQVKREYWIESIVVVWWHLPITRGYVCQLAHCWLNDTLVRHRGWAEWLADPLVSVASTI